jgi:thioredoxin-like negative regulator of GroEL
MSQLLILFLVFAGVTLGGYAVRLYSRKRQQRVIESVRLAPHESGRPRILSFYGPSCDACERQKQVLSDLERSRPGEFALEFRDATLHYDDARQFGLMIVPTTIVISASGKVTAINSGFAPPAKLEEQLAAA